ncbi:MAG: hypothetical protein IKC48_00540 [Clostridia bacterium]|nr:hypothetical protein [Clostridia bacterium]
MYNVSDLLGKPLLSISDALLLGTISNIYFDPKLQRGTFVMLYTAEDERRFFPLSKISATSGDAATTLVADELTVEGSGVPSPINCYAFDHSGSCLGIIKDVVMDGCKVVSFIAGEHTLCADKLISIGSVLVFNSGDKPVRLKPKKESTKQKQPIAEENREENKDIPLPQRVGAPSYEFLLGKKLQRTIVGSQGNVIGAKGEDVTDELIDKAKKEGKLVILALNAL